jgi:hypothetical protein
MVYKPLAVRVALIAGFRRAMPVFRYMIVVVVAVVMWESPQGFPRGVGRVESRLLGFPCFPYPGISMACFLCKIGFGFAGTRQHASWHAAESRVAEVKPKVYGDESLAISYR